MRKILLGIFSLFLTAAIVTFFILDNKEKDKGLKTIKLAEVTHSIFYAPMYAAISEGYFEDNGYKIDLILTPGADKVTAAVLSGDVDIGFCGPEATIYVYNSGEKDYLKVFGQLTNKDGSFLVSRRKYENFTLKDLKGKTIIGGRKGALIYSYNF